MQKVKTIVRVDKEHPEIFRFDAAVKNSLCSYKIKFQTEIFLDQETGWQAESVECFDYKIQLVAPEIQGLKVNQTLLLNLTSLYEHSADDALLNIVCIIKKLKNANSFTHLELHFSPKNQRAFFDCYENWLQQSSLSDQRQVAEENAYRFVYQYYKRLYCDHLTAPVFFSQDREIKQAFISELGRETVSFENTDHVFFHLPINIIQSYVQGSGKVARIPLYVWFENDRFYYFSNSDFKKVSPRLLIGWLMKKPNWRVYLIRIRKTHPVSPAQREEVQSYVSEQAIAESSDFESMFQHFNETASLLDISSIFQYLILPSKVDVKAKNAQMSESDLNYQIFCFKVLRVEPRFELRIQVNLQSCNQENSDWLAAETLDISFLGLNIFCPDNSFALEAGNAVLIDFASWNEAQPKSLLKKKERIEPVEYTIENIEKKFDGYQLGLKRIKRDTEPRFNALMQAKISEISQSQEGHIRNDFDLYQSLIASSWVNNNITGLVFFLGKDAKGIRIIQAIVETRLNQNLRQPFQENDDWSFLQKIALPLSLALPKTTDSDSARFLSFGLYCFFEPESSLWQVKTDLEFESSLEKAEFIKAAIAVKKHFFFHCTLTPVKAGKDDILNGESSSLISIKVNKLKQIHEICHSLLAVGELNDVTRLVEFLYKN